MGKGYVVEYTLSHPQMVNPVCVSTKYVDLRRFTPKTKEWPGLAKRLREELEEKEEAFCYLGEFKIDAKKKYTIHHPKKPPKMGLVSLKQLLLLHQIKDYDFAHSEVFDKLYQKLRDKCLYSHPSILVDIDDFIGLSDEVLRLRLKEEAVSLPTSHSPEDD